MLFINFYFSPLPENLFVPLFMHIYYICTYIISRFSKDSSKGSWTVAAFFHSQKKGLDKNNNRPTSRAGTLVDKTALALGCVAAVGQEL